MNSTVQNNNTITILFAALTLASMFAFPNSSMAQEGEGESVSGAISLSMMAPADPYTSPPQMKQSSKSIDYPDSLLRDKKQGQVELKILVGIDGKVSKVEVLSSTGEPFTTLATEGVLGFDFAPAQKEGAAVETWVTMGVGFKIQDKWSTAYHEASEDKSGKGGESWAYVADVTSPEMDSDAFQKNLVYPIEAKTQGIQGIATIKALVSAEGTVLETQVEGEADPLLAAAAAEAIKKTPFKPGVEEGAPKQMWTMIPVSFTLSNTASKETTPANPNLTSGKLIEPSYDPEELQNNISHFVENGNNEVIQVRVLIGTEGQVEQVLVPEEADLLLSTAAVQAIKRTTFKPGIQGGQAIPVWISIPVKFQENNTSVKFQKAEK